MNNLEEKLRHELRHEANQARPGMITPLREPAPGRRGAIAGHDPIRLPDLLAPIAAALAVAVVVAGLAIVKRPDSETSRGPGTAQVSAARGGMPPFYVTLDSTRALVRASGNGRLISSVPLPRVPGRGSPLGERIAAAADGRTYVIVLGGHFFRLRLAPDGRPGQVRALPIPPLPGTGSVESIALTPDGRHIGLAIQLRGLTLNSPDRAEIAEVSVATGALRTWLPGSPGLSGQVSWASNTVLAYSWDSEAPQFTASVEQTALWLLDTHAPGSRLFLGRRVADSDDPKSSVILPGGRAAIFSATGISEISARTGAPRDIAGLPGEQDRECSVLSAAPAGVHVLLWCGKFGRIDNGVFTALPGSPAIAAW